MRAVTVVIAAGVALGALGLVEDEMYMVGAIIVFIGVMGLIVRLGEILPWVREQSQDLER
jgi:hypothetical protein